MTKPSRYHWLFLFALLCRLLAGEQAMADASVAASAADCAGHTMMLMHAAHAEHSVSAHADMSAAQHSQQMHDGAHHSLSHTPADEGSAGASHGAGCDIHDCCPTGACDCACVNLTLLSSNSAAAPLMMADITLATSRQQPAPPQRPERVFRPPA